MEASLKAYELLCSCYNQLSEKRRGKIVSPACWFENWPPYAEDKERPKKEVSHSRVVGGRFHR